MKKCIYNQNRICNKKRIKVKSVKAVPFNKFRVNYTLPVYKFNEHNEILEEMAKKALEVLKD